MKFIPRGLCMHTLLCNFKRIHYRPGSKQDVRRIDFNQYLSLDVGDDADELRPRLDLCPLE